MAFEPHEPEDQDAVPRAAGAQFDRQAWLFEALLSSVRDYLYVFDPDGRFVFANTALLDLWGLTSAEAIGKTMRELAYPPNVEEALLHGVRQVIQSQAIFRNETYYTNPAGMSAYYENLLTPILDDSGQVQLIAGDSRDITDRKQSEAALEQLAAENARLYQVARSALETRNQVLAYVAHDQKNALAIVMSAAEIIALYRQPTRPCGGRPGPTDGTQHREGRPVHGCTAQ